MTESKSWSPGFPGAVAGATPLLLAGSLLLLGGFGSGCDRGQRDIEQKVQKRPERKRKAEMRRQMRAALPRRGAAAGVGHSGLAPTRRPSETTAPSRVDRARGGAANGMTVATDAGAASSASGGHAAPGDARARATAPSPNGPRPRAVPDEQGLVIARVVTAARVVKRKPQGVRHTFAVGDGRVYCFVDARNPNGPERMLQVVWQHEGKLFHRLRLRVGVGHVWRTWAYVRLRRYHVGRWRCTVRNESGAVLGSADFQVVSGDSGGASFRDSSGTAPRRAAGALVGGRGVARKRGPG